AAVDRRAAGARRRGRGRAPRGQRAARERRRGSGAGARASGLRIPRGDAVRRAVLVLLGLFALGCGASETYRPYAFVPGPRHYRVRYLPGEEDARRILPAGWRVRDHRVDGEGRPTAPFDERRDRIPIALDLDE